MSLYATFSNWQSRGLQIIENSSAAHLLGECRQAMWLLALFPSSEKKDDFSPLLY